jgi:hypothetical protein
VHAEPPFFPKSFWIINPMFVVNIHPY